jgi:hypothetical protein
VRWDRGEQAVQFRRVQGWQWCKLMHWISVATIM